MRNGTMKGPTKANNDCLLYRAEVPARGGRTTQSDTTTAPRVEISIELRGPRILFDFIASIRAVVAIIGIVHVLIAGLV
jgi:hypothetical protein